MRGGGGIGIENKRESYTCASKWALLNMVATRLTHYCCHSYYTGLISCLHLMPHQFLSTYDQDDEHAQFSEGDKNGPFSPFRACIYLSNDLCMDSTILVWNCPRPDHCWCVPELILWVEQFLRNLQTVRHSSCSDHWETHYHHNRQRKKQ